MHVERARTLASRWLRQAPTLNKQVLWAGVCQGRIAVRNLSHANAANLMRVRVSVVRLPCAGKKLQPDCGLCGVRFDVWCGGVWGAGGKSHLWPVNGVMGKVSASGDAVARACGRNGAALRVRACVCVCGVVHE